MAQSTTILQYWTNIGFKLARLYLTSLLHISIAHLHFTSLPHISTLHLYRIRTSHLSRLSLPHISTSQLYYSSLPLISTAHLYRSSLPLISTAHPAYITVQYLDWQEQYFTLSVTHLTSLQEMCISDLFAALSFPALHWVYCWKWISNIIPILVFLLSNWLWSQIVY